MFTEPKIRETLLRKEISLYRLYVSKAEQLKTLVRKFDGKVFNKRFNTALEETFADDVTIRAKTAYPNILDFELYAKDRYIPTGEYTVTYVRNSPESIRIYSEFYHNGGDEKTYPLVNGRINAEMICKGIDERCKAISDMADKEEEQLNNIDSIMNQFNTLWKQCSDMINSLDYHIRETYDITFKNVY